MRRKAAERRLGLGRSGGSGGIMAVKTITSVHNPRVKRTIRLRNSRHRAKQGQFLIDGARELLQALSGHVPLVELFLCVPLCKSPEARQVLAHLDEIKADVWHAASEVFGKMEFGQRHDGVLAVAETPRRGLAELEPAGRGLIAVLEGLEKPGNVGAVLRSADGAGVSAVIVADPRTDLYNPNCIRASLGTVFTNPVCTAPSPEVIEWLRRQGSRIFAARLDAKRLYTEADLGDNAAVVLGNEAGGLSAVWQAADVTGIKLPMHGTADSLNVSAASAVLFYEALRQREQTARG
ncbi:MAG: TrmH family RNA methyltransferase [Pirellulales bacterium]